MPRRMMPSNVRPIELARCHHRPPRAHHRRQPAQRVALRTQQGLRVTADAVRDDRADVEQEVHRQVAPEDVRRHRLDVRPDEVALRVVDRERREAAGARAADVPDARRRHVEAAAACDLKAQVEIDVLEVTEEALVEASEPDEPVAAVERRRTRRPEDLLLRQRRSRRQPHGGPARRCRRRGRRHRPNRAGPRRRHARSCSRTPPSPGGSSAAATSAGEPLRVGGCVGIEQRDELAVVEHRDADVVRSGKADVLVQPEQRHAWIRRRDRRLRLVGARVVDDDDPVRRGSVWPAIDPTASSRKPSALKLTMMTPTVGAVSLSPTWGNHAHRLQPFTTPLAKAVMRIAYPLSGHVTHAGCGAPLPSGVRAARRPLAAGHPGARGGLRLGRSRRVDRRRDRRRRHRLRAHGRAQAAEPDRAARQRHGDPDARRELRRGALPRHARARPAGRPAAGDRRAHARARTRRQAAADASRPGPRPRSSTAGSPTRMPPGTGSRTRGPRSTSSSASRMRTRSRRSRGRPAASVTVQPNVWAPAWRFLHGTYTVGRGLPFTWPLFHRPARGARLPRARPPEPRARPTGRSWSSTAP